MVDRPEEAYAVEVETVVSERKAKSRKKADKPEKPVKSPAAKRKTLVRLAWIAAVVVAAGLGFLAAYAAFAPPAAPSADGGLEKVTVSEATVGRYVPFATVATWTPAPAGVGNHTGVVTTTNVKAGDTAKAGTVLYTIDLRPVVIGTGSVPSFRDLSEGATGQDVAQLQQLLRDTGHLEGEVREGTFDWRTTAAVTRWQKSLGLEQDGVVRAGDVVYTAKLPARVTLAKEVTIGKSIDQGQSVVNVLSASPEFTITLNQDQAMNMHLYHTFQVEFGDELVTAVVNGQREDQNGGQVLVVTREDGSPICGDKCADVPVDKEYVAYGAKAVLVEEASGPSLPTAAVQTDANGDAFVLNLEGERVPVTIIGQGDGRTVLEGVENGQEFLLPRSTAPTPGNAPVDGGE